MKIKLLLLALAPVQLCFSMQTTDKSVLSSPSKPRNYRDEMQRNHVDPETLDFSQATKDECVELECQICLDPQEPQKHSTLVYACNHHFICSNCKVNAPNCTLCNDMDDPKIKGFSDKSFKELCLEKNYICHICEKQVLKSENVRTLDCNHLFHENCLPDSESFDCTTCHKVTPLVRTMPAPQDHNALGTLRTDSEIVVATAPSVRRNQSRGNENSANRLRIQSKLGLYASEGIVACLMGLTARTLFDKGYLTHEKSPERNTSWSILLAAFLVSQKTLDDINPSRQNNLKEVQSSWLVGGLIGLALPSLLPTQNKNPK